MGTGKYVEGEGDEQVREQPMQDHIKDQNLAGPYRMGKTLGEGQFGIVKAGEHSQTGQHVAIKIVKKKNFEEEEVRIQRMLDHKNLVKVIEVLDIDDTMYIVMEQVTGGDLFDYLVKHVRLKENEAQRLFQQIIDGVDHCHSTGVVHRDLKAENILLDEDRNVKIADFGLAAQTTPGEPLTKSCGSPNYAAPELLHKGCTYEGPEIDVWSCGVILYALLTIRLPFDAPNIPDLFRLIKKGSYTVPGYVSEDAKDLISRMLTIDPKARISVAEIKQHKWFSVGLPKKEALLAVAQLAVTQEEAPAAAAAKPAVAKTLKFGKRRSNILPPSMLPEKKERDEQRSAKVGLRTRAQSAAQVNRKSPPTRSEYSASCGSLGMLPTKFDPAMMVC